MKLLLDTHAVLWFWWDDARLAGHARRLIADATNEKLVSLATPWEVAIKVSLGKLDVGEPFTGFFPTFMSRSSFEWLPMRQQHFDQVVTLPFHHRDPFDRMLVSQALCDDITLVSRERVFDTYGVRRAWD